MNNNNISDLGAQIVSKALKANESLVHLNLNHNDIWENGILYLSSVFEKNVSLISLNIFWCEFSKAGLETFWKLIKNSSVTYHFDFGIDYDGEEFKLYELTEPLPEEVYAKQKHFFTI